MLILTSGTFWESYFARERTARYRGGQDITYMGGNHAVVVRHAREKAKGTEMAWARPDRGGGKEWMMDRPLVHAVNCTSNYRVAYWWCWLRAYRAGELNPDELERIVTIIQNPTQFKIPNWFMNRQKDIVDGKYGQLLSNQLDSKVWHLSSHVDVSRVLILNYS